MSAHEVLPVFDLGSHDPEVIHRAQLDDTFLSSVISAMKNGTPPPDKLVNCSLTIMYFIVHTTHPQVQLSLKF